MNNSIMLGLYVGLLWTVAVFTVRAVSGRRAASELARWPLKQLARGMVAYLKLWREPVSVILLGLGSGFTSVGKKVGG